MQLSEIRSKVKCWLLGPATHFKVGDTVQTYEEDSLMVVVKIYSCRAMQEPLILCKWHDKASKANRANLFLQSRLKICNYNSTAQSSTNLSGTIVSL